MTSASITLRRPPVRWVGVAVDFTARMLVAVVLMLLFWTLAPVLLGWQSYVIMSGSMAPRIVAGDVVLAQPLAGAQVMVGQVILMDNPVRAGTTLVHRAVGRNPDGSLITRGDANPSADSTPVQPEMVRALPRLRVPYVGLPAVWWSTGDYRSLGLSLLAGIVVLAGVRRGPPAVLSPAGRGGAGRRVDTHTDGARHDTQATQRYPARHRRGRHGRHAARPHAARPHTARPHTARPHTARLSPRRSAGDVCRALWTCWR